GHELRGGVPTCEFLQVVEVAVVQSLEGVAQGGTRQPDVDHETVVVELLALEGSVDDVRRTVQSLRRTKDLAAETVSDHDVIADVQAVQRGSVRSRTKAAGSACWV